MTPLEQLKHEARSMMFRAEQENDGPSVTRYAAQLAAVEALEQENAKLREALEPFADIANYTEFHKLSDDTRLYLDPSTYSGQIEVGDLRRAARVLAETNARKEVP